MEWIILLCLIGTLFICVEIFIPGFGIFGILGAISILITFALAIFVYGLGIIFLIAISVASIILGYIFYLIIKKFDLDKYIILNENLNEVEEIPVNIEVGNIGVAKTDLKNYGMAIFSGEEYEVCSTGSYISLGSEVKIVKILGNKIIVDKL